MSKLYQDVLIQGALTSERRLSLSEVNMAKKSIKKNYILNAGYQVLLLITPLITAPYISRVLGADSIGQYSYANSIVSYFTLFATLGITTYGRREISYIQDKRYERSMVFWETKLLQIYTSGVASIIFIIFALSQTEKLFYLLFVFNILAVAVDVTWFFQGMEEFGKIVLRNSIFKFINIVYIFCMVKEKDDLILYVFGITFFTFLSNCSLWIALAKYVDKPKWSHLRPFRDIRTVLSLFIPTIAIEIYTVLDKTMIGVITQNSSENGYYEMAIGISRMSLSIVTALGTVMTPRIGYHFQKNDTETLQLLMYRGYRFVWFLGTPLCLGLIGISYNFVPWFFGTGYNKVSPLLCILSFLIFSIGINNMTGVQYLIPTKRQNLFTVTVIIGAGVNFIMNMFLINWLQSVGAAVASVAAETVIALVQLYFIKKELSIKKVFLCGTHYWIAGIAMLIVLLMENQYISPSIFHTGIMIGSGSIIYFIALCIMRDEFFLSNIRSVLRWMKSKMN